MERRRRPLFLVILKNIPCCREKRKKMTGGIPDEGSIQVEFPLPEGFHVLDLFTHFHLVDLVSGDLDLEIVILFHIHEGDSCPADGDDLPALPLNDRDIGLCRDRLDNGALDPVKETHCIDPGLCSSVFSWF